MGVRGEGERKQKKKRKRKGGGRYGKVGGSELTERTGRRNERARERGRLTVRTEGR